MGGGGTGQQQAGNGSMAQMGQQGVGMPGGAQGVQGMGLQSMMSMQAAGGQQNPFTTSAGNPFTSSAGNPFTASPAHSAGASSFDPFAGLQGTAPKQTSMQATPGFAPVGTSSMPFKMPAMPQTPAMAAQAAAPAPAPGKYPVPPNAHAVSSPTIAGNNNLGNYYAAPSGLPVDAQGNIIQHFAKINNIHDFLSANSNVAKAPTYTYDKSGKLTTS